MAMALLLRALFGAALLRGSVGQSCQRCSSYTSCSGGGGHRGGYGYCNNCWGQGSCCGSSGGSSGCPPSWAPPPPPPPPPPAVNCQGSWGQWSDCSVECGGGGTQRRQYSVTRTPSGGGAACQSVHGADETRDCGEGVCTVDCAGTWSACTAACESAGERTWSEFRAREGDGAACPMAQVCRPGDGACPVSPAEADRRALLAFKDSSSTTSGSDSADQLSSWQPWPADAPCGSDWAVYESDWTAIQCQAGRVTYIVFTSDAHGVVAGDVSHLAGLRELRFLNLMNCPGIHGDVGALASLTELRALALYNTAVFGSIESLAAIPHIGEDVVLPDGRLWDRNLPMLGSTRVYGRAAPLRAIAAIGPSWGSDQGITSGDRYFTPCSVFTDCPAGQNLLSDPESAAGTDACACCGPEAPRGTDSADPTLCINPVVPSEEEDTDSRMLSTAEWLVVGAIFLCVLLLMCAAHSHILNALASCGENAKNTKKELPEAVPPERPGKVFELESVETAPPVPVRPTRTLHSSNFKRYYDVTKAPTDSTAMWRSLEQLLRAYCVAERISWEGEGARFLQRLVQEAHRSSDDTVAERVQRMWSSALQLRGSELCSVLNYAARVDTPQFAEPLAVLVRAINLLCVTFGRSVVDLPALCFRGGGFDEQHRQWYDAHVGQKMRQPSFVATSASHAVADSFMVRSDRRSKVRWLIRFDPVGCVHVNLVSRRVPGLRDEREYLFAPYSAFTLQAVRWGAGTSSDPHQVELLAAVDNKAESELLPLAPWV